MNAEELESKAAAATTAYHQAIKNLPPGVFENAEGTVNEYGIEEGETLDGSGDFDGYEEALGHLRDVLVNYPPSIGRTYLSARAFFLTAEMGRYEFLHTDLPDDTKKHRLNRAIQYYTRATTLFNEVVEVAEANAMSPHGGRRRTRRRMKNPCWKGYKAYGMKRTRKGKVPNCVPRKTRRRHK